MRLLGHSIQFEAEKSQLEEMQAECSEKATQQLKEMKDTPAVGNESIVTMEEQVRNLLQEKQELQQTIQDKEREVGRVRDNLECVEVQVCPGRAHGPCSLSSFTFVVSKFLVCSKAKRDVTGGGATVEPV